MFGWLRGYLADKVSFGSGCIAIFTRGKIRVAARYFSYDGDGSAVVKYAKNKCAWVDPANLFERKGTLDVYRFNFEDGKPLSVNGVGGVPPSPEELDFWHTLRIGKEFAMSGSSAQIMWLVIGVVIGALVGYVITSNLGALSGMFGGGAPVIPSG